MKNPTSFLTHALAALCLLAFSSSMSWAQSKALSPEEEAFRLAMTMDEYNSKTPKERNSVRIFLTICPYIEYADAQISVNLTESQAAKLGLTKDDYAEVLSSFKETNEGLAKLKAEGLEMPPAPRFKEFADAYKSYLDGKMTLDELKKVSL